MGLNLDRVGDRTPPIPVPGTVSTTSVWSSVHDKGDKGAVLNMDFKTVDSEGRPLVENRVVLLDRSAGNFGGDRGTKRIQDFLKCISSCASW